MAKATIAFSKARGKVGGLVFRHDAGIGTVVSEYNPHPTNPRTMAQTDQRAKMNLAGQLSKVTPYAAIAGFSTNKRKARSKFVSILLKAIENGTHSVGETFASTLDFANVKISDGVSSTLRASVAIDASTGVVTTTLTGNTSSAGMLGCIVLQYIGMDGSAVKANVQKVNEGTSSVTLNAADYFPNPESDVYIVTYVVPIRAVEENTIAAYGQMEELTDGFSAEVAVSLSAQNAYCQSIYAGKVRYQG